MFTERDIKTLNDWGNFLSFKPTWVFKQFLNRPENTLCLFSGNQWGKCLTYQTLIDTPDGEVSVGELFEKGESFKVYAWDGKKKVIAEASAPFKKKGLHECYRITMSDGRWIEAADHHRILTERGWRSTLDVLHTFSQSPHVSTSDTCPSTHVLSGQHYYQRQSDYRDRYSDSFRQGDGQPLCGQETFPISVPSQGDARQRNAVLSHWDVQGSRDANTLKSKLGLPSSQGVGLRSVGRYVESLFRRFYTSCKQQIQSFQASQQLSTVGAFGFQSVPLPDLLSSRTIPESFSTPCDPPLLIDGNHIISIKSIGCQAVYDFTVAKYHNYFAGGLIHHNTSTVAFSIVLRIMGMHPIASKNMRPDTAVRVIRCASETLPTEAEGGEVRNTQYPAIRKWLPTSLIKKDLTFRKPVMTIKDPQGGPDIYIEFVSYNQEVQSQAGVQRFLIWMDESAPQSFYEEQKPRLLQSHGDLIVTLTPAESMGYEFDEFFERAKIYIRTKTVCDRIKKRQNKVVKQIETTDSHHDIAVLMAATDDSPIYADTIKTSLDAEGKPLFGSVKEYLDSRFDYGDEDIIDIRRYGIFKQVSGQIFKDFQHNIHVISKDKYFPEDIPDSWFHSRAIDYHEQNPWACMWASISPDDEVFVWEEFNPSPDKYVTLEIARQMAYKSGDYRFALNKIDPNASKKQSNTATTVIEDLNRHFYEFRRANVGTGGYWTSWDTHSTKGRDEIRKRLKNARQVGRPFNNRQAKDGHINILPTLWFLDNCKQTIMSFRNWRLEEWNNREMLIRNDEKEKPQQKWSHFPMCLEALFKESGFRASNSRRGPDENHVRRYFGQHRVERVVAHG